jgi:hypothetical protein
MLSNGLSADRIVTEVTYQIVACIESRGLVFCGLAQYFETILMHMYGGKNRSFIEETN